MLRVLEAFQAALFQGVDTHHLGAAFYRFAQRFQHARVVGAGVLAPDENRVGMLEVVKGHGAFADTDALGQGHAAGFVAHVRAIREVVGAIGAHEQLIQVRRFVAGTARGIELGHVRAGQGVEVLADQGERRVPTDGLVAVGCGVIAHWFGQATLVFQPIVALLQQRGDAVLGEEGAVDAALGGFPVDGLGAVLAELDHAAFRRVAPGAARAVKTAVLVGLEHHADVFQRVVAGQPRLRHADQRAPAAGRAFVGLVARGRGLVGLVMITHGWYSIAGL